MALSIKNPEADQLARTLARLTDETLTETVVRALRERLVREQGRKNGLALIQEVKRIQTRVAALPVLDARTADDILGYDEEGLPA